MSDGRSSRAAAFIMDFNDGGDKNCEYSVSWILLEEIQRIHSC